jgi:hypothetical protein
MAIAQENAVFVPKQGAEESARRFDNRGTDNRLKALTM